MNKIKKEDIYLQLYQNNFQCCFNSGSYQHHHDQCHKVCFNRRTIAFTLAIVIVVLIDIYEYRCEREDQINLKDLENRIEKLEGDE